MDLNIALVGVLLFTSFVLAAGAYLENRRVSRTVPVIRQLYSQDATRRYRA